LGGRGEFVGILAFAVPLVLLLCIAFVLMGVLMSKRTYGRVAYLIAVTIAVFMLVPVVLYPFLSALERRELLEGPGAPTLVLGTFSGLMILPIYWLGRFANAHGKKKV